MMLLYCNVWCSESDENRKLGLPDGDCWMPMAINLKNISAIKIAGENDFIGKDKACVYIDGGYSFIIDLTYYEVIDAINGKYSENINMKML